jgi:hypothetical protein
MLAIVWDQTRAKSGKEKGLHVFAGGKEIARGAELARLTGRM